MAAYLKMKAFHHEWNSWSHAVIADTSLLSLDYLLLCCFVDFSPGGPVTTIFSSMGGGWIRAHKHSVTFRNSEVGVPASPRLMPCPPPCCSYFCPLRAPRRGKGQKKHILPSLKHVNLSAAFSVSLSTLKAQTNTAFIGNCRLS